MREWQVESGKWQVERQWQVKSGKWRVKGRALASCVVSAALVFAAGVQPAHGQAQNSATAGAHFEEAQKLLRQGNPDAALREAQEGLKHAPRSVEGLDLVGIVYAQKQDYAQAVEAFEQALKIDPRSARTLNSLGNSYLAQKKIELAEKEFRETLRYHPVDREANYNLGLILFSKKDPRQAIVYFSRVRPQDSEVLFNLTQAYFATGQKSKALELAKLLSDREKNDVRTHFTLGILLAAQKLYPDAIHEFELADALKPGTFEILHDLGQACLRAGNNTKAEEVLQRARQLKPDSADTLYLLAQANVEQGKNVQALELLVEARKLAPENTDVIFLLARMSMLQDYFEDAIQVLEEGVKIAPRRADLHAALGECYFTGGKVDRAHQEFQTLIDLDPSARSYAFMGLSYRHQGQFDEAKKYFNEGLAKDPRNAPCLFNLGYIEHKQGHYVEAEKYLAQALEVDPNYAAALYDMAGVKMSEKKYAEALPLLRRAAELLPQPGEAYYKLATAERNLHQSEAAQRDMKVFETLSKDPKSGPYPFQHLFESVGQRAELPLQARAEFDIEELRTEAQRNPDRPSNFYLLAEAYLKLGRARRRFSRSRSLTRSAAEIREPPSAWGYCWRAMAAMRRQSNTSKWRWLSILPPTMPSSTWPRRISSRGHTRRLSKCCNRWEPRLRKMMLTSAFWPTSSNTLVALAKQRSCTRKLSREILTTMSIPFHTRWLSCNRARWRKRSRLCAVAWRAPPTPGGSPGDSASWRLLRGRMTRQQNTLTERSISCLSGKPDIPPWASFIMQPARLGGPAKPWIAIALCFHTGP